MEIKKACLEMGTVEGKFYQLLSQNDLSEALKLWESTPELPNKIDINLGFKWARNKDPPLHCLLRHGNYRSEEMRTLLQIFLDKGADPSIRNALDETALHIVCCSQRQGVRENKVRCEVLELLLQKLPDSEQSSKKINQPAKSGNLRKLTKWLQIQDLVSE